MKDVFAWSREQTRVESETERHLEEVRRDGFTVLPAHIPAADALELRRRVLACYDAQSDECGGHDALLRIGDHDNAKGLCAYDPHFLGLLEDDKVLGLVEAYLEEEPGDFVLYEQRGVIHRTDSGNKTHPWHRDIVFQHLTTSRPLGMTALYCLDDYGPANGATEVLPGSHLFAALPSHGYIATHLRPLHVPLGSIILFDVMLFHRGGPNRGATPRLSITEIFTLQFVRQEISFPDLLGAEFEDDSRLSRLLGYRYRSERSIRDARWEKLTSQSKAR